MTLFLALDIGCLECGESTRPLGLFKSHDEAQAACDKEKKEEEKWRTGQHSYEVFEMEMN